MIEIKEKEKGVSLVIAFLIMSVILAVILSITSILSSEIKIISNMGNSVSAFYAASAGAEKTLYYDRKQIPNGGQRGFCNICNVCSSDFCQECSATSLSQGIDGCEVTSCSSCQIKYKSSFDDRDYTLNATVTPDFFNPGISIFKIKSKGDYKNTSRSVELNSSN